MADIQHNPMVLPEDLPVPQDDGAARHLTGVTLPHMPLAATDGTQVDLASLRGRTVVYIYPRTGRPGQALPTGWDGIPGARGCTPQSCGFRDHLPIWNGSVSRICSGCRRRIAATSARPPSGCICRSRSCPMAN